MNVAYRQIREIWVMLVTHKLTSGIQSWFQPIAVQLVLTNQNHFSSWKSELSVWWEELEAQLPSEGTLTASSLAKFLMRKVECILCQGTASLPSAQPQVLGLGAQSMLCGEGWWDTPADASGTGLPVAQQSPYFPSQPQDLLLTLQSLPIRLQSWPEFRHQMLPVWIAEGLDQLRSEIAVSFFWGDASPPGLYGIRSILDSRDNSSFPVRCLLWCKH